jgi:hypothetical protein
MFSRQIRGEEKTMCRICLLMTSVRAELARPTWPCQYAFRFANCDYGSENIRVSSINGQATSIFDCFLYFKLNQYVELNCVTYGIFCMPLIGQIVLDMDKTGRILVNAIRLGEWPEMAAVA